MAFIGIGISHAALGGVALGMVLGMSPMLAAIVFSVGVGLGDRLDRGPRPGLRGHSDRGVFPTAMALGVALISLSPTYRQDLMGYLFGEHPFGPPGRRVDLAGLATGSLGILAAFFKEFLFLGVDEEAARAAGLPSSASAMCSSPCSRSRSSLR